MGDNWSDEKAAFIQSIQWIHASKKMTPEEKEKAVIMHIQLRVQQSALSYHTDAKDGSEEFLGHDAVLRGGGGDCEDMGLLVVEYGKLAKEKLGDDVVRGEFKVVRAETDSSAHATAAYFRTDDQQRPEAYLLDFTEGSFELFGKAVQIQMAQNYLENDSRYERGITKTYTWHNSRVYDSNDLSEAEQNAIQSKTGTLAGGPPLYIESRDTFIDNVYRDMSIRWAQSKTKLQAYDQLDWTNNDKSMNICRLISDIVNPHADVHALAAGPSGILERFATNTLSGIIEVAGVTAESLFALMANGIKCRRKQLRNNAIARLPDNAVSERDKAIMTRISNGLSGYNSRSLTHVKRQLSLDVATALMSIIPISYLASSIRYMKYSAEQCVRIRNQDQIQENHLKAKHFLEDYEDLNDYVGSCVKFKMECSALKAKKANRLVRIYELNMLLGLADVLPIFIPIRIAFIVLSKAFIGLHSLWQRRQLEKEYLDKDVKALFLRLKTEFTNYDSAQDKENISDAAAALFAIDKALIHHLFSTTLVEDKVVKLRLSEIARNDP
jgi:hypothetical protein